MMGAQFWPKTVLVALAFCLLPNKASAQQGTELISFSIAPLPGGTPGNDGAWFQYAGNTPPYGLSSQPTLSGRLAVDISRPNAYEPTTLNPGAFTYLDYTTGSRTWTLSDIHPNSYVFGPVGDPSFLLRFTQGASQHSSPNGLANNNTVGINDGFGNGMACNGCVSITSIVSGLTGPPSSPLAASVIGAWGDAIQFINNNPSRTEQIQNIQNCLDTNCDNLDALINQHQLYTTTGVDHVRNAAIASQDLVNSTGVDLSNPADVIAFLLVNGQSIVENVVDFFDIIFELDPPSLPSPSSIQTIASLSFVDALTITDIGGTGYDISESGFAGTYYDVTLTAMAPSNYLRSVAIGDAFITQMDLGNGETAFGQATFNSWVDGPEYGTMQVEFQGFVPNTAAAAIPEPSTWLLMIFGFGALGAMLRLTNRQRLRGFCEKPAL